jgi:actin-related protein
MELMTRTLNCEALYKLIVSRNSLIEIIKLMNKIRVVEKYDISKIDRLVYVVYSDCMGDMLDIESSDAFYTSNIFNFLFIDQYSDIDKWDLISHELIHYLQQYLYLYPNDTTDVWQEDMALKLHLKVRDIICSKTRKNMIFKFITDKISDIEEFITYKRNLLLEDQGIVFHEYGGCYELVEEPSESYIEKYFGDSLKSSVER